MVFYLKRIANVQCGQLQAVVVCASDEPEARLIASQACTDEGPNEWLDSAKSTCNRVGASDHGVVCGDFRSWTCLSAAWW